MSKIKSIEELYSEITEEQIDLILKEGFCPYHRKKLEDKGHVFVDADLGSDIESEYDQAQLVSLKCPNSDVEIYTVWTNVHGPSYITWKEYMRLAPGSPNPLSISEIVNRDERQMVREALAEKLFMNQLRSSSHSKS